MKRIVLLCMLTSLIVSCVTTSGGSSAKLHYAIANGNLSNVSKLIEQGYDINVSESITIDNRYQGGTPIQLAIQYKHNDILLLLIENGANINFIADASEAIKYNNEGIIDILYENKSTSDDNGVPFLHIAADRFQPKLISFLLEKGYDVNEKDEFGNNALIYAVMAYGPLLDLESPINEDDTLKFISDMPYYGSNTRSIQQRNVECVSILLNSGIFINSQNNDGWNALHFAASCKPAGLVEILLEYGADKSIRTNKGNTAYILASLAGNSSVINLVE